MKMRKFNPRSFDGVFGYETPAIAFESNEDRDRAVLMIEAMEWQKRHDHDVTLESHDDWHWYECLGHRGSTPLDAILAAKRASELEGAGKENDNAT